MPTDAMTTIHTPKEQFESNGHHSSHSEMDTDTDIVTDLDKVMNEPHHGPTLLWSPVASLISGVTGVTAFSVRVGSQIGGWGVTAGREATLKSLEMSRAAVEAILLAAGRDVNSRRNGELGRYEAESIMEKSISALHAGISAASFFASSGFFLTQAGIDSLAALSLQSLGTLNAVLGSTESSRAVAAIVTLIKDELQKPGMDGSNDVVGYGDLLIGTVGFVFLQRWGRRKTEFQFRDAGGEETIWDTVIDDKGFRADVVGMRRKDVVIATKAIGHNGRGFMNADELDMIEREVSYDAPAVTLSGEDQIQLSDEEIRIRIMDQLPQGAKAVITSETLTLKTVKVEIHNADTTHIEAPPGMTMVSEHLNQDEDDDSDDGPSQTIVFRTALQRSSSAEIEPIDRLRLTHYSDGAADPMDVDDVMMMKSPLRSIENVSGFHTPTRADSGRDLQNSQGPLANQKRSRKPVISQPLSPSETKSRLPVPKSKKEKPEKSGIVKRALKTLSPTQSAASVAHTPPHKTSRKETAFTSSPTATARDLRMLTREAAPRKIYPMPVIRSPSPVTSPDRLTQFRKDGTTTNYFTVHEKRRESTVSQTDTYSIHSNESRPGSRAGSRPGSPTMQRAHLRAVNGLSKAKSHTEISTQNGDRPSSSHGSTNHRRSRSFVPSLYSMGTRHSEESIILAPKTPVPRKSIYEDQKMLVALATDGKVPGIFPNRHLIKTVRRFARFASASYGSNFLRVMGLSTVNQNNSKSTEMMTLDTHHEHSSFSSHTGLPPDTILLSSFFDPKGMSGDATWTNSISPLIHFISVDRESKAVVLTCRGTLGFEDVLTDMTCDYDDIYWQGESYKVHKGIHASARRLLNGGSGSRVMATIKATLEEFPDFGLILCGHSLGGAVAAVLAILISEPSTPSSDSSEIGTSFVTSSQPKLISDQAYQPTSRNLPPVVLPAGRPIHVYAYGTPATVSPSLRLATRGLITTIVNANDIVPSLSLGTLHDFRAVARHFKSDTTGALINLQTRIIDRIKKAVSSAFYVDKGPPPPENMAGDGLGEDNWAWDSLNKLRQEMSNEKLVPPGEVFVLETTRVFDRLDPGGPGPFTTHKRHASNGTADDSSDSETEAETAEQRYYRALGRPATRVQFKLVRDVEGRFAEIRFGRHMFGDHSPGRYEAGLGALEKGICEN